MDFNELLEKYQALQIENNGLKEEIARLKVQFGVIEPSGDKTIDKENEDAGLELETIHQVTTPD